VTEQRRSTRTDQEWDLIRRIQNLAHRAERTAFDHSNLVGPPPSQQHLDILAEIRALTEQAVAQRMPRPSKLPRQAPPVEDKKVSAPVR
jgi:DNA-binding GntR family transcriptional regulator